MAPTSAAKGRPQATFTATQITGAGRPSQGIGAGELQISETNNAATADQANIDLAVKAGEWIMLGTMIADPNAPTQSRNSTGLPKRPYFRWYRVVTVGPIMRPGDPNTSTINRSGTFARNLTISGAGLANGDGGSNDQADRRQYVSAILWAFIYDGAVAVYERTVHLEGPSMWSN